MEDAKQNTSPTVRNFWKNVKEDITPEEFIELIASQIGSKIIQSS